MKNTPTDGAVASSTQPVKPAWDRPRVQAFDTRAEISAYSGDRDLPWIKR